MSENKGKTVKIDKITKTEKKEKKDTKDTKSIDVKNQTKFVTFDGNSLTIQDIVNVARFGYKVKLEGVAEKRIVTCSEHLKKIVADERKVYGITTGFGVFQNKFLTVPETQELSRNIIVSHAIAVGKPLSQEVVKAAMLVRINAFAQGVSGVRLEIVQTFIDMINKDVIPLVPENGSLASSGDLCLLSHLALVMTEPYDESDKADGEVYYQGQVMSGQEGMNKAGIKRVRLIGKEGLALTNGASFSAAIGSLATYDAMNLWKACNLSTALSLEALKGVPGAFDARIHNVRPYPGAQETARHIRQLTEGSKFISSENRIQDAYSLRCVPQVNGAVYDAILYAQTQLEIEVNSATDNPLIFSEKEVLSGGNFHGQPVGLVLDHLKVAITTLSNISERRCARLVDDKLSNGLPCMLVHKSVKAGLNSGLMIPQYTAVSLTLKNGTLSTPDSVHSLPTSAGQEDHNANGMNAALHLLEIIENTTQVLAIEMFSATRGMYIRKDDESKLVFGGATGKYYKQITAEDVAPFVAADHYMAPAVGKIAKLIKSPEFYTGYDQATAKNKRLNINTPIGTRDLHPNQMIARNKVLKTIRETIARHGVAEIQTPVFELREILMGKYGENGKLVYDLEDQGQKLSLRYDLTVPLARYCAQHNVTNLRRMQVAEVFRRDSPAIERGRYRSFYQFDTDFVGAGAHMLQDAEILYIMDEVLKAVDIGQFCIKLSHRKLLQCLMDSCKVPTEKFTTTCSSVDKLDKEPWSYVEKELLGKELSLETVAQIKELVLIKGRPREVSKILRTKFSVSEGKEINQVLDEMDVLFDYLEAFKCTDNIEFDLSLARGLDYYTGIIFEAITLNKDLGIGSIAAGGRYDGLIGMFHPKNKEIPAVGCSFGVERLFAIMEKKEEKSDSAPVSAEIEVLVHPLGKNMMPDVLMMCDKLWKSNIKAVKRDKLKPDMKEQIEFALENKVPYMVIVGEKEKETGSVGLKIMSSAGQQMTLTYDECVSYLQTQLNKNLNM